VVEYQPSSTLSTLINLSSTLYLQKLGYFTA